MAPTEFDEEHLTQRGLKPGGQGKDERPGGEQIVRTRHVHKMTYDNFYTKVSQKQLLL